MWLPLGKNSVVWQKIMLSSIQFCIRIDVFVKIFPKILLSKIGAVHGKISAFLLNIHLCRIMTNSIILFNLLHLALVRTSNLSLKNWKVTRTGRHPRISGPVVTRLTPRILTCLWMFSSSTKYIEGDKYL